MKKTISFSENINLDDEPEYVPRSDEELEADYAEYKKSESFLLDQMSDEERAKSRYGSDYGNVGGRKLELCSVFSEEIISQMDIEALRSSLLNLQAVYLDTRLKLHQYRMFVPKEIVRRDPSVAMDVYLGIVNGRSDQAIAEQIGESARFVQDTRLELGRGRLMRQRGRPKKSPKTP